jgi:hypothetical protein
MNRIPYHRIPPADAYQRVQQAQETRQPHRAEAPEAAPDAKPAAKATAARPTPQSAEAAHALSRDEAGMIDRYFPAEPKTALRLYGRGGATTVQPSALGSRLDLSA